MNRDDIKFYAALGLIAAVIISVTMAIQAGRSSACEQQGGVYVKTSFGYSCVKGEVIP